MSASLKAPRELLTAVQKALPRSKRRMVDALAMDLSAVWWGLRTAVLVDSCMLSEAEARSLGRHLQAQHAGLLVLHEPVSSQTLVINRALLEERLHESISFVDGAGSTPVLLPAPPEAFAALLDSFALSPTEPFVSPTLPDPNRPQDLIPLVGFLLDYPVAYSLEQAEGPNCLAGAELVVVEASLVGGDGQRQRLLSFSYPLSLASAGSPLVPTGVIDALERKLTARLATAQAAHEELRDAHIGVEHRTVVLDQVAL